MRSGSRTNLRLSAALISGVLVLHPVAVNAEEPGDPNARFRYAGAHCAGCHAVRATDNTSPNPAAPSFANVAKSSGIAGRALAVRLETSHPTMPNLVVGRKDRDDVIAYIMSLQVRQTH
jgi:mono/diheme cytochrome c family protein